MDDRDLFVLFLEMTCFSKKEAEFIFNDFENSGSSMIGFVKLKLSKNCKTTFLFSTLKKFSIAYDDLDLRREIESVINKDFTCIKGDFHVHTNWSDGSSSIEEIVNMTETMGYKYVAITDHSLVGKGKVEMDEKKFMSQIELVDKIQKTSDIKIIKGVEIDINNDGSLDYSNEILKNADIVIGSVHFDYGQGQTKAIKLLEKFLDNQLIDIIAHPLNKIGEECFLKNYDRLFSIAEKNMKVFEINLSPERIKESNFLINLAKGSNVMFSFGTDSHSAKQMKLMSLSNLWCPIIDNKMILNTYEDPITILKKR